MAEALRFAIALALPVELLLIVLPDVALRLLFPAAYAGAAPVLRLMAIGNAALIAVAIVMAAFQAIDRSAEVGRVLLVIVPLEILALALVVPRFGAIGAVTMFDAASLAAAAILGIRYVIAAGVPRAPLARWIGRFALAVGVGGIVALATWQAASVYVAVVAGGVVYYGLVLALGLVPGLHLPGERRRRADGRPAIADRAVTPGRAAAPEDG